MRKHSSYIHIIYLYIYIKYTYIHSTSRKIKKNGRQPTQIILAANSSLVLVRSEKIKLN